MQRYFPRERKPTRGVNRSPTNIERRDRVGGVEAAGKVDSTRRESFFLAPRLWENVKLLPFWRNNCLSSSSPPFSLSLFLNLYFYSLQFHYIKRFFLSLVVIATVYIFYYLSTICRNHNVEKRSSHCKTVHLWKVNVNLSIFDMFLNYFMIQDNSLIEFTYFRQESFKKR